MGLRLPPAPPAMPWATTGPEVRLEALPDRVKLGVRQPPMEASGPVGLEFGRTSILTVLGPGLAKKRQAVTLLPGRMISQLGLPPPTLFWAAAADCRVRVAPPNGFYPNASPLLQERVASSLSLRTSLPLSYLFVPLNSRIGTRIIIFQSVSVNPGILIF